MSKWALSMAFVVFKSQNVNVSNYAQRPTWTLEIPCWIFDIQKKSPTPCAIPPHPASFPKSVCSPKTFNQKQLRV